MIIAYLILCVLAVVPIYEMRSTNGPHLSHRLQTFGSLGSRELLRLISKLRSSRKAELCSAGMVLKEINAKTQRKKAKTKQVSERVAAKRENRNRTAIQQNCAWQNYSYRKCWKIHQIKF